VPPPPSTPAPSQASVVIHASYELRVEGEITPRTENRLRAMFDEHDRELIGMVQQGVR
jgi:hypothetical protein